MTDSLTFGTAPDEDTCLSGGVFTSWMVDGKPYRLAHTVAYTALRSVGPVLVEHLFRSFGPKFRRKKIYTFQIYFEGSKDPVTCCRETSSTRSDTPEATEAFRESLIARWAEELKKAAHK